MKQHVDGEWINNVVLPDVSPWLQAKGTNKEWGVKSIKKRREDEHGNIEFLVEWDGDWAETWEPQVNLENAQHKIDAFLASGSQSAPQVRRRRKRTDGD